MTERAIQVRALGEIAIRARDMQAMEAFYRDVLDLRVLRRFGDGLVFFDLGESHAGHTAVLALFDAEAQPLDDLRDTRTEPDVRTSTLHHIALTVDADGLDAAQEALAARGVKARQQVFAWAGWRSLFLEDPEGNVVELVSRDPALTPEDPDMP